MKLPKFIKSRSSNRDEKQQSQSSGGRQLLITELQFQPHKNAAAIMNFDKSLYMTPQRITTLTPKFANGAATENARAQAPSGRFVKSAQPKRLQRTPKCYVNTPAAIVSSKLTSAMPMDLFAVKQKPQQQQQATIYQNLMATPTAFRSIVSFVTFNVCIVVFVYFNINLNGHKNKLHVEKNKH